MKAEKLYAIFQESIVDYHKTDDIEMTENNPYSQESIEYLAYHKNWIDTVQWHLEDIIRSPHIATETFIETKRRIDKSNQERTDVVELMDDWFSNYFSNLMITPKPTARMNSESIAWLVDRMSILMLKIYHMDEQTQRIDVDEAHIQKCHAKLAVLMEQKGDLGTCFDELLEDIIKGDRFVKVYRQMKMYNDKNLNPYLYEQK